MKSRDFCFWLMGSLELNDNDGLDQKQTQILKNHLDMVFVHMVNDDGTLKDEITEVKTFGTFRPLELKSQKTTGINESPKIT